MRRYAIYFNGIFLETIEADYIDIDRENKIISVSKTLMNKKTIVGIFVGDGYSIILRSK